MNKKIFFLLSWTWGIILTLPGFFVYKYAQYKKWSILKTNLGYIILVGKNWGGFNLGAYSLIDEITKEKLYKHEAGHSIQNCFFGPFMLFIVTIPSIIRYWYRKFNKNKPLPSYDAIWFESMATKLGNKFLKEYKEI